MATPKNSSVIKAFQILKAVGGGQGAMSSAEVAGAAGLNAATTHRFLLTLEELGAVGRTADNRFQLGMLLADLGREVERRNVLAYAVGPHIHQLVDSLREAVSVAVLEEGRVAYVARGEAARSLQIGYPPDQPVPLHCSGVGKVLLAGLPPLNREEIMARLDLVRYTDRTITDLPALRREIARVGEKGYALDDQEMEEGLRCIAVPILDGGGATIATLSASGPASRMTEARIDAFVEALRNHARQVTQSLYGESLVLPEKARPRGSFPHVKWVGDFAFVSGTSARRPDETFAGARTKPNGEVELDIRTQARATIENLRDILRSIGAGLKDLTDVEAYLVDMVDYEGFNEVYARYFGYEGPARTTVAVRALPHPHQLLMMKAIAHKPSLLR